MVSSTLTLAFKQVSSKLKQVSIMGYVWDPVPQPHVHLHHGVQLDQGVGPYISEIALFSSMVSAPATSSRYIGNILELGNHNRVAYLTRRVLARLNRAASDLIETTLIRTFDKKPLTLAVNIYKSRVQYIIAFWWPYLKVEDPAVECLVVRVAEDCADAGGALRRAALGLSALTAAGGAGRLVLPDRAVLVDLATVHAVRGPGCGGGGGGDGHGGGGRGGVSPGADLAAVALLLPRLPLLGTAQHGTVGPLADDL